MTVTRALRAAAMCAALAVLTAQLTAQRSVTLFVPAFEGPDSLGRNVARILNLQIQQTLRNVPSPNPANVNFGEGQVVWDNAMLADLTHEQAARAAVRHNAGLALWGRARPYGDGVVVQSYLTIVRSDRTQLWQVNAGGTSISIDMPRLQYEFKPFALQRSVVDAYSESESLKLYESPSSQQSIGTLGKDMKAIEQRGSAAQVESEGKRGWVRLPPLTNSRTEVVDFTGGMIRMMRSDWGGAADLFQRVITNADTPTTVKLDAFVYRGLAAERAGSSGLADFKRAHDVNPYDRGACSFLLMSHLSALSRLPANAPARAGVVADARRLLQSSRYLYPRGDAWLKRVDDALSRAP